jgi:hypothetical protein
MMDAVSNHDRIILRLLAQQVRDIANRPEMLVRKCLWHAHNAIKPERPMVLCFPEGAWNELLPRETMRCENEGLRQWEYELRRQVYWFEHLNDDNTVEPYFNIPWAVDTGSFGVETTYHHGANRGSYVWDPPIKDVAAQLPTLHFRQTTVDRRRTHELVGLANDLFGDILPARIRGRYWWTCGLTSTAIRLVGLEQLMWLMCDRPEDVHQLMAFLRDDMMHFITFFERQGLLAPHNANDYTGSGGVGYTRELEPAGQRVTLRDLWGFSESQETVGVSPAMFGEFIFPYQMPLLEQFGLNCYGCCEPVHLRLEYLLRIPRLRRVSVSPWCDQQIMADALQGKAVFSRKPNPALVCVGNDEAVIRRDLCQTLQIAGRGALEIIMKDTHTVENQPWRVTRWVEIVREEADRHVSGTRRAKVA